MNQSDIHPIQSEILCKLLFVDEASFSELNKKKFGSDQFSFHLKQLSDWDLIEKNNRGKYCLTIKGKEYANRFDTDNTELERQAKVAVLVVCEKIDKGVSRYLLQQRLKQPYFGYWGFITGKMKWGETVIEAAKRELEEETGLDGKIEFRAIKHKMDYDEDHKILEDKYFYICLVTKINGVLTENFEGGKNQWMSREEILAIENLFDGVEESIDMAIGKNLGWSETKYKVKGY